MNINALDNERNQAFFSLISATQRSLQMIICDLQALTLKLILINLNLNLDYWLIWNYFKIVE